jgi:protein tyrosine/serine phosphatase
MDAPEPTPAAPPPVRRRITRRTLFKLAGGAAVAALGAEVLRVTASTNVHTVVPDRVYRTAQLKPERLQAFIAEKGIRTVVNLRGVCSNMDWYLAECRTTHAANVNQEDITFSAKRFPAPTEVQRLVEVLDHTEYPLVFHCQAGADRTGVASTAARLLLTDDDLPTARRQLWPRYGHLAVGRTAVLDAFFDYYGEWLKARGELHAPDRFRKWVASDYCPGPYRAHLSVVGPQTFEVNRGLTVIVRAANASIEPWHFTPGAAGGFRLRYTLTDSAGGPIFRGFSGHLARTVRPGEHIDLACGLAPLPRGAYMLHADLVDAQPIELLHTDFAQYGSDPLMAPVYVV